MKVLLLYLPTGLLVGLAVWTGLVILPGLESPLALFLLLIAAMGGLVGLVSLWRPALSLEQAALFLVGIAFVAHGVLTRQGLSNLYLFLAVGLLTAQLTAFRRISRPLITEGSGRAPALGGLASVYGDFVLRQVTALALTFLIAILLIALAPTLLFDLTLEIGLVLVALGILLLLVWVSAATR